MVSVDPGRVEDIVLAKRDVEATLTPPVEFVCFEQIRVIPVFKLAMSGGPYSREGC